MGHIISQECIATNPKKVEVMVNWLVPTSVKKLKSFLGLTEYYRKLIFHYGILVEPLTDIFKKDAFQWSSTAQQAFLTFRKAMTKAPILAMPKFSLPLSIETYTNNWVMGAASKKATLLPLFQRHLVLEVKVISV